MFKTLESFQKQLDRVLIKKQIADTKVTEALRKLTEANQAIYEKADNIRAEADALIVRANQINKMVDAVVKNADL